VLIGGFAITLVPNAAAMGPLMRAMYSLPPWIVSFLRGRGGVGFNVPTFVRVGEWLGGWFFTYKLEYFICFTYKTTIF
jgi:hypothetical protein